MDFLTTILVALFGALGFGAYRYHSGALSKATAKADALAEVVRQNRTRAIQTHTETMETIDAKEAQLENADSHSLAGDLDALFGGGVPVPEDGADGGGSSGPL